MLCADSNETVDNIVLFSFYHCCCFPDLKMRESNPGEKTESIRVVCLNVKEHCCPYCRKLTYNLPLHLECIHAHETSVQKALSPPTNSTERVKLFKILQYIGDNQHNLSVLQNQRGFIIPANRSASETDYRNLQPCDQCLGWFKRSCVYLHKIHCIVDRSNGAFTKQDTSVKLQCSDDFQEKVLSRMKISHPIDRIAQNDDLICKMGNHLLKQTSAASPACYDLITQRMLEVASLLLKIQETMPMLTMTDCISRAMFNAVVTAVKQEVGFDEVTGSYATPSLSQNFGHSLLMCAIICMAEGAREKDLLMTTLAGHFYELCKKEWQCELSKEMLQALHDNLLDVPSGVQLLSQVGKVHQYVSEFIKKQMAVLEQSPRLLNREYIVLAQFILADLVMFNRWRSGEVENLTCQDVSNVKSENVHPDILSSLSPWEQHLCTRLSLIEVVGKRGRKVPVLLTSEMYANIQFLLDKRREVNILQENPYLFGIPFSDITHRASDCLQNVVQASTMAHPEYISSTELCRHVTIMYQLLSLKESEQELLAAFLGQKSHTLGDCLHLEDPLQMAKVTELLIETEIEQEHSSGDNTLECKEQEGDAITQNKSWEIVQGAVDAIFARNTRQLPPSGEVESMVDTSNVQGSSCDTVSNGGDSLNPSLDTMTTVSTSNVSLGESQTSQEGVLVDDFKGVSVEVKPEIVHIVDSDSDSQEDVPQQPSGQTMAAVVTESSQSTDSSANQSAQLLNFISAQLAKKGIQLTEPGVIEFPNGQTISFAPAPVTNPNDPVPVAISANPVNNEAVSKITHIEPAPISAVKMKLKQVLLSKLSRGKRNVIAEAEAVKGVTRQEETMEGVTRQEEIVQGVTRQKAMEGVTRQEKAVEGVTRQEKAVEGVTRQEETVQGVTRQEKAVEGVTRQEESVQGVTRQEETMEEVTRQEKAMEGVTRQEKAMEGVTRQEETVQGVTRQEKAVEGVTRLEETVQGVTRQEKAVEGVIRQEKAVERVTRQEESVQGVTRHEETMEEVTRQEKAMEGVTRQGEAVQAVTTLEETIQGVARQEKAVPGVTRQEEAVQGVTGQKTVHGVTGQEEAVKWVTRQEEAMKWVTRQEEAMEGVTREEEAMEGVTRQEETMEGVTRQEETVQGVTRQEKAMEGVTRQEEVMEGVTRQEKAVEGVTRQEEAMEGVTRLEETVQGVTRQEKAMEGVNRQEETVQGVNRQEKAMEGITRQEEAVEGVTRQEKAVEGVTRQEEAMKRLTRQEEAMEGVTRQKKAVEGVTRQEEAMKRLTRQEEAMEGVTRQKKARMDSQLSLDSQASPGV
ncbi:uncharacterized protein [Diadema antillarum]